MKITICSSLKFFSEILEYKKKLEKMGHEVFIPKTVAEIEKSQDRDIDKIIKKMEPKDYLNLKNNRMLLHLKKINDSDAILVLNYKKNNIENYIGANTLIEMGLAFWLNKKIFILNSLPKIKELTYVDEIMGMKPIIINSDLTKIK